MVQLSNLALKHLVEELHILENGFVNKVQTLENGWIKMKIHTKEGGKDLILAPNALFVSDYSMPAKMNPGGYSAFLKKYLFNQRVVSLEQRGVDRIVILEFPEHYLVVELFAKGNLVLVDNDWKIIKALKREEWKDRKLEKDAEYKFPSSKGMNPLDGDEKDFISALLENEKTSFGACIDLLNVFPAVLEKVFTNLELDKKKNADELSKKEAKSIFSEVKKAYSAKEGPVFVSNNTIYSIELSLDKEKEFENINSALNELLVKELGVSKSNEKEEKKKDKKISDLEIKKRQIISLEKKEKEFKETGDLIYLHYNTISEVLDAVKKGEAKGLSAKEIRTKINSVEDVVENIDLKNKKVVLKIN